MLISFEGKDYKNRQMKKMIKKGLILTLCISVAGYSANAQAKKRVATKRNTTQQTTNAKSRANVQPMVVDTVVVPALPDSMPMQHVKTSLRPNSAIERNLVTDRTPLAYEHLREDDAVYRQKIWREIDTREKMNLPFRYAADEDNGNQRFISILFKAIQDGPDNGGVTVFSGVDDRFTTPLTVGQVATIVAGEPVSIPQYGPEGQELPPIVRSPEVNLDSFYKFRIKEEVIFDKESSRLFWRIIGIAPIKNVITSTGVALGDTELFWVYYPDMRPIFAKYEVYNGKNYGARMSWEELFESRMFYGRIIKSTIDNPYDQYLRTQTGLEGNSILQLLEGENIKEKIFNYEQNLWSY